MKMKSELKFDTDISFVEFQNQVCKELGRVPANVILGYKLYGEEKHDAPTLLHDDHDWSDAIDQILEDIAQSRTWIVGIDVVDTMTAHGETPKSNKWAHESSEASGAVDPGASKLASIFNDLEAHLCCDTNGGHCHINPDGGHCCTKLQERTLWAKKMSLDPPEVTLNTPTHSSTLKRQTGSHGALQSPLQILLFMSTLDLRDRDQYVISSMGGLSALSHNIPTYPIMYPSLLELLNELDKSSSPSGKFLTTYSAILQHTGIKDTQEVIDLYTEGSLFKATSGIFQ
ncbi:hypothetical protein EDD16DRAFT_1714231 [Pisolithus croceorrhizus]|nr:hypothetical protein EDD16DRAFT_1714231 [Pisolithus croceorrhizus]